MSDGQNEVPLGNSDGVDKNVPNSLSGDRIKKIANRLCGDIWLAVFKWLCCAQLGLEIAPINRRFDIIVDEHFITRQWSLVEIIRIRGKIGEDGTKAMEIVNADGKSLPIPQNPPPNEVIGFRIITIQYFDRNVLAFLRLFLSRFDACEIFLAFIVEPNSDHLKLILLNIWPMLKDNIRYIYIGEMYSLRSLRRFFPSILSDCPSLRFVHGLFCPAFPPDESANALDDQALTKWLLTPRLDGLPKVFMHGVFQNVEELSPIIKGMKAPFLKASSAVSFVILFYVHPYAGLPVPFELINAFTGELLELIKRDEYGRHMMIRSPISRDKAKWTQWEKEAIEWESLTEWNNIEVELRDDGIGEGLLDAIHGQSDQQHE